MSKIIGGTTATPMKFPTANQEIQAINSLKYYGDATIVPSDADLFKVRGFVDTSSSLETHGILSNPDNPPTGDVVIPYSGIFYDGVHVITRLDEMRGTEITSAVIPNSVNTFHTRVFENCIYLTRITIPDSVTFIGEKAFSGCTALTEVYYKGTKEQWDAIEVGEFNEYLLNATIHYECVPTTKGYVDEKVAEVKPTIVSEIDGPELNVVLTNNLIMHSGMIYESLNVTFDLPNFGDMASLCFCTPETIPTDYTTFPKTVVFKGDSTEDDKFVAEPNIYYTMVFEKLGDRIIGYVSGVTL